MLLTVTQSNAQENKNTQVTVPITRAEFVVSAPSSLPLRGRCHMHAVQLAKQHDTRHSVIKALANHLIPRLLGFDVVLSDSFAS
ncbi:hypothetical protein QJQ45_025287 [Haematococcus lacustris]|nr:hypothetical protein QJQ45_025287 [Haematococcus lacustris]